MQPNLKNYFKFSKIERRGIIALTILILLSISYNVWIKKHLSNPNFEDLAKTYFSQLDEIKKKSSKVNLEKESLTSEMYLEKFDPNKLDKEQWISFGLKEKQADVILNYLSKGGIFRIKNDLKKMYSISEEKYLELKPYINLPDSVKHFKTDKFNKTLEKPKAKSYNDFTIAINSADSAQFIRLKGIGPVLSSRIIKYRNGLGGFYSINQIAEVYGVKDSIFENFKHHLILDTLYLKRIAINLATAEELKAFPYFKWKHANAIVKYRKQHGAYNTIDDLYKVILLDSATIRKIEPYLKFE